MTMVEQTAQAEETAPKAEISTEAETAANEYKQKGNQCFKGDFVLGDSVIPRSYSV
jgi:hypothetical protein